MLGARCLPTPLRAALVFFVWLGAFHGLYQLERRTADRFLDRPLAQLAIGSDASPADGPHGGQEPPAGCAHAHAGWAR